MSRTGRLSSQNGPRAHLADAYDEHGRSELDRLFTKSQNQVVKNERAGFGLTKMAAWTLDSTPVHSNAQLTPPGSPAAALTWEAISLGVQLRSIRTVRTLGTSDLAKLSLNSERSVMTIGVAPAA